jgi:hypothetical protein
MSDVGITVDTYLAMWNEPDGAETLRVTPAMEAGVADHVWSLEETAGPSRNY